MKRRLSVLLAAIVVGLLAPPVVSASAEDPPPSVTLTSDRSVYLAGQTARFTSKIVAHNLDWLVQVRYPGNPKWYQLCASFDVNDSVQSCTLGLTYNVTVRAALIDDKGTQDTADDTTEALVTRNIGVKPTFQTTPLGYFSKSGNYAVMSKYSAKFLTQSSPAFPGKRCLRHQVQQKKAAGWRTVKTSACVKEGNQGRVEFRWGGSHPSKVKFRVRPTFAGDAANRANAGAWKYFRFR